MDNLYGRVKAIDLWHLVHGRPVWTRMELVYFHTIKNNNKKPSGERKYGNKPILIKFLEINNIFMNKKFIKNEDRS